MSHCRVRGTPAVWAIGDATNKLPKHGGLAAWQADCAARRSRRWRDRRCRLAVRARCSARSFAPAAGSLWLQRDISDPLDAGVVGHEPLWSPPAKIAARRLVSLLATQHEPDGLRLAQAV